MIFVGTTSVTPVKDIRAGFPLGSRDPEYIAVELFAPPRSRSRRIPGAG